MGKEILLRNRIKCKKCGNVIESKNVHDFQTCKCGAVSVDGGTEYTRVLGEVEDYETLYRWMKVSEADEDLEGS